MTFQAFMSPGYGFWTDNVSEGEYSDWQSKTADPVRYRLTSKKIIDLLLDDGDSYTPSFAGVVTSDWRYLVFKVTGACRVHTVGFDSDDTTPIDGYIPMFGVAVYPGIYLISTYNLTSFTIDCQADDTSIELFAALAEDEGTTAVASPLLVYQFTNWNPSSLLAGNASQPTTGASAIVNSDIIVSGPTAGAITMTFNKIARYAVRVAVGHKHSTTYSDRYYFSMALGGTAARNGGLYDFPNLADTGAIVSEWETAAITCSLTINATTASKMRQVNDEIEFDISTTFIGANAQDQLIYTLPAGMTVDVAKLTGTVSQHKPLGFGSINSLMGQLLFRTATDFTIGINATAGAYSTSTILDTSTNTPKVIAAGDVIKARFSVPILAFDTIFRVASFFDDLELIVSPSAVGQTLTIAPTQHNIGALAGTLSDHVNLASVIVEQI